MVDAHELTEKWVAKTLQANDILEYLTDNLRGKFCHSRETLMHVAWGCFDIYMFKTGQTQDPGDFASAVINNDLSGAVHKADDVNRLALWLYVGFLYNVAPAHGGPEGLCPRCGKLVPATEFGVLRHEACGYCQHPSRRLIDGWWVCEICGHAKEDKK